MLATKLYGDMGDWPNEGRLSALNIRRACDASLRRLQTDYIDLYQMHHVDRDTGWDEIWEAFEVLRSPGQDPLRRFLQLRRLAHRPGPGSGRAAQLHGTGERAVPLQPAHPRRRARGAAGRGELRTRGHPVVAAARAGFSVGSCARSARAAAGSGATRPGTLEAKREQLGAYEDLCAEVGEEPGTVGLAWLLTRPAVTGPIVGPRTPEQLESALRSVEITLDDKVLTRLDEIFPGHRTAPEDYAW